MSGAEASGRAGDLRWDDAVLNLCESAPCACGHSALDHAWHGCDDCDCKRSALGALLTSGVVTVTPVPTQHQDPPC